MAAEPPGAKAVQMAAALAAVQMAAEPSDASVLKLGLCAYLYKNIRVFPQMPPTLAEHLSKRLDFCLRYAQRPSKHTVASVGPVPAPPAEPPGAEAVQMAAASLVAGADTLTPSHRVPRALETANRL